MPRDKYAELVRSLRRSGQTQSAFVYLDALKPELLTRWAEVSSIYSPSGHEASRAEYMVERLRECGFKNAHIDDHGNAVAWLEGEDEGPTLAFFGTMDDLATVAEMVKNTGEDRRIADGRIHGPGTNIGATLVTVLALAKLLRLPDQGIRGRVYLVCVTQEETGLAGARGFIEDHVNEIDFLVDVMAGIGRICYGALGIHWFKVHFKGPRGHTLRSEGPNVTKGVAGAVDRVWALDIPSEPEEDRVYLNISMLGAGKVYNHKHDDGWFSVDLRSLNDKNLEETRRRIVEIAEDVAATEGLGFWVEDNQKGSAGLLPGARESELVRVAEESCMVLGVEPNVSPRGSSNMNVGIRLGISSISIGGERGGGRNTAGEYANLEPVFKGVRWCYLTAKTLCR
jgi:acetylornithine deacetylase/succinyl-diaminopimelate desuccinylase-like protein